MKRARRSGSGGVWRTVGGRAATAALALAVVGLAGCQQQSRIGDHAATAPINLFDGQSLDGWVQRGGDAVYRAKDGAIVGETRPNTPNTFLCTTREFADFRLELEFMVDDELNSGVQFRSGVRPEAGRDRVYGYQAEIDPSPRAFSAGVYEEAGRGWLQDLSANPAAQAAFRPLAWNTMVVECRGSRLQTSLNGVPATDLNDSNSASGFIALQVHDVGTRQSPLRVRWRNIRLFP